MPKSETILEVEAWCKVQKAKVSAVNIYHEVLTVFCLSDEQVAGPVRNRPYVEARGCFVWFMRRLTGESNKGIGEWLNGRDHASIIHLNQRTEDLLSAGDENTTEHVTRVYNKLKQLTSERV